MTDRALHRPDRLYAVLIGERLAAAELLRAWLDHQAGAPFAAGVLARVPGPQTMASLEQLEAAKHGCSTDREYDDAMVRIAKTIVYVAMVSLAWHEHHAWKTSVPPAVASELAQLVRDVAPEAWHDPLDALRAEAQRREREC